jgi:MFS family permease
MTDYLSLYANEVLGYSELNSAALTTGAIWMRAFVAILAGFLADRINSSKIIGISFAMALLGAGLLALGLLDHTAVLVILNLALVIVGVYGLRSLYFALIQEARIPIFYTGTAVGIISILGFTPDIFLGPWLGYLLDNNPGAEGHHKIYAVLVLFAVLGLVASFLFISHTKKDSITNSTH